jgi:hypothetical protein
MANDIAMAIYDLAREHHSRPRFEIAVYVEEIDQSFQVKTDTIQVRDDLRYRNVTYYDNEILIQKVILDLFDLLEEHHGIDTIVNDFCFFKIEIVNPDTQSIAASCDCSLRTCLNRFHFSDFDEFKKQSHYVDFFKKYFGAAKNMKR